MRIAITVPMFVTIAERSTSISTVAPIAVMIQLITSIAMFAAHHM